MTWYLYSMIQYGIYCMCLCRQLHASVIMIRWCFCDALIGSFALHDAWGTLELPSSQDSMSSTAWNRWMLLVSCFSCPGMVAPNVLSIHLYTVSCSVGGFYMLMFEGWNHRFVTWIRLYAIANQKLAFKAVQEHKLVMCQLLNVQKCKQLTWFHLACCLTQLPRCFASVFSSFSVSGKTSVSIIPTSVRACGLTWWFWRILLRYP